MFHTHPTSEKLNFHLETQGEIENSIFTDTRSTLENNFLGYDQKMPPSRKTKRPTPTRVTRSAEEARAIKLRKLAKNIGVVSARRGRTRSDTKTKVGLAKIQSSAKSRHRRSLMKHISLVKVGDAARMSQLYGKEKFYDFQVNPLSVIDNSWDIPDNSYQSLFATVDGTINGDYTLIEQIRRLFLQNHFKSGEGVRFKVAIFGSDSEDDREVFGTKYFARPVDLLRTVQEKIREILSEYEAEAFDVARIVITVLQTNIKNAAAAKAKRSEMDQNYIIPAEYNTNKNCAYTAIVISKDPVSFMQDYVKQLQAQGDTNLKIDFTKYAQKSRDMKYNLSLKEEIKKGFASSDDLETYVLSQVKDKRDLIVRDCQFKIVQKIEAPRSKDSNPRRKKKELGPPIELQRVNNHIRPLIPRSIIPEDLLTEHDAAQLSLMKKPVEDLEARRIVKDFIRNARQTNDEKIMSADIETSTVVSSEEELKRGVKVFTYAAGCAWYRDAFDKDKEPSGCESHFDGDKEILYKAWWGEDSLVQYMLFLDANQVYFDKTTIYFHNGGKFDLHQLIRDCLFEYWGFTIMTDKCVMSNGRWINFGIEGEDSEAVMTFKDSISIMPSSLAKLSKDYKVPHYKKDDVDHNTITINNWSEQKDKLEIYLRHDCLSLLEVLKRFSDVIYQETFTEKYEQNKDEVHTLNILEALVVGSSFTKRRDLPWLKCPRDKKTKLELDGFDENLGIAVEVQSPEHYTFHEFYHKNEDGFQLQQERDQAKVEACQKEGVTLLVVPYTECFSMENLVQFLTTELEKTDFTLDKGEITEKIYNAKRVIQSGHLNMTQCMTASGLTKKWFYHEFYDKKKYPIFTLTSEQDAFIRDQSYLGGRVELFRLGQVGEKVYYLDFTSLYPSQMINDLPYGEPYEAKFEEDVLPDHFFGFVRCMVESTDSGLQRLPLHGEKIDGKLQFRHLTQPREMVLFTEEIRLGMKEELYTYKFIDGLGFKRGKHLKPMVEKLFKMKADAKENGQDALSSVLKIVLNSLYGFWGTRIKDREGLEIYRSDGDVPFFDRLNKQQLVGLTEHERYTVMRVEKDLPIDDINVSIAAATTSYSRNKIWMLMDAIKQRGTEVFMCDTDSVITNCNLSKHTDLLDQFIPDWESDNPGSALGSLKCECTDEVKKALKSKYSKDEIKILLNEMRGGDSETLVPWCPIPYDDAILSALKTYALRKVLPTGTIFTFKHKGVSKSYSSGLTAEQEEQMWDRYLNMHSKNQPLCEGYKNLQFRCGLSSYMSENLTPLLKFEVPKNVTAKYDKGIVAEDYVNECKTITTLNNDNDQPNMCSSAPLCSLVMERPYESHDHYRRENKVESFPSDFGAKTNGRPGPVAGLTFMEVEQDKSLGWYRDIVTASFSNGHKNKNSQWKDLAMYIDENIYKNNEYKISKKNSTKKVKNVPNRQVKMVLLKILEKFDLDKNTMRDVRRAIKRNKIDWNGNKNFIKQFVDEYSRKSNIEKLEFSKASAVLEQNIAMTNVQIAPADEIETARGWVENEEDEFVQCESPISIRMLSKRSYGEQYVDEFIRYYEIAQVNKSRSLPMRATAAQKNPIDKHAFEDYDSKCVQLVADMKSNRELWVDRVEREQWNLNLLVDDLYVIDLDTPEAVHYFETTIKPMFEDEFSTCPLQKTRKGFHYFFVRPTGCTHFNKARAYRNEDGEPIEIDCCTISSTGTRGNINVFPSKNKFWLRSIHEFPPQVMSERLYQYLDKHYIGLKTKAATKTVAGEKRPREQVNLTTETKYWTDYIASRSGCNTSCITWSSSTRGRLRARDRKCLANPNHIAEHDNAFIDIMPDGSLKYTCKSARCGKTIVIAQPINCGICQF